ncbi:MAG TPA: hypothetical protein VF062_16820 [Candidatus Limnocylindrales bacterium]
MTVVRSRRAGISAEEARQRPMYARALGLQYLRPSGLLCFAYFEGAIALAVLLALAELADWWILVVLPLSVAAMVKLNDVIAGAVLRASSDRVPKAFGRASVPTAHPQHQQDASADEADEGVHSPQQRARQSGARRYE